MKHLKLYEKWRNDLPSSIQIGEEVEFIPMAIHCDKFKIEKEVCYGRVTSVYFTEAKVFYDILDDYRGKIFEKVDSFHVKKLGCGFTEDEKESIKSERTDHQSISC